jgi:hypothetical protein
MIVTFIPLLSNKAPNEAEVIPLPKEDTTPPVTKINLVSEFPISISSRKKSLNDGPTD